MDKTIEAGVNGLKRHQVSLTREQWLKEAERCEMEGSPRTCEAIVKTTVAMELEDEDRLDTWVGDAEAAEAKGMVSTSRAILSYALKVYPHTRNLWRKAADLEKAHGTRFVLSFVFLYFQYSFSKRESLDAILDEAVTSCPQAEVLWLMAAKEKWLAGDVPAARQVLERAFVANPESEQIWLAAVKLEAENGELKVARELLIRARTVADTQRVSFLFFPIHIYACLPFYKIWMKSAVFERQQGHLDQALTTISTALTKFPKFGKLYMIQGQIHQSRNDYSSARASFAAGVKSCPKEPTLWILASKLEEADGKSIKARALLEKARLVNSGNELLWAESIGVEERSGGAAQAKTMLSRALQECPSSGLLWSMAIWAEPRAARKTKGVDALRKTKDHPLVVCAVARVLWADRVVGRAREWFGRATATDPDLGDIWGWWLKFERQHGTEVSLSLSHLFLLFNLFSPSLGGKRSSSNKMCCC